MGLLDMFDNGDAQFGLGLLAAAAPRADGAGFGQRLMEGVQYGQQWKQQKQKDAYMQTLMDAQKSELEQRKLKAEQERRQLEIAAAKQAALPTLFTGGQQALAPLAGDSSIGILPSAGRPAVAPRLDVQRALAAQYTPDEIMKLDSLRNIGQNKVARTIKGIGPDGKEYEYQVDEMGNKVGDGFAQYKAPLMQDLGGNVSALDPYTLTTKANFPKTMTFGDKAAMGNLGVAQQRLALDQANQYKPVYSESAGGFIVPPSKSNPQGALIPLAGGQGNVKMTEDQAKASGWLVQATNAFNNMVSAVRSDPSANKAGINDAVAGIPMFGETVANMMRGEDRQKYIQGASSLSEALLRAATGAGVNRDEALQKVRELTPQIGDSDAVIKQKQDAIPLYLKTLEMRSGPGARNVPSIMQTPKLPGTNLPSDFGSNNDPLGLFLKR